MEREILIDETSQDEVLVAGMDLDATQRARNLVESFQEFIQQNIDEITALQILFSRPYAQRLEFGQVRELAESIERYISAKRPAVYDRRIVAGLHTVGERPRKWSRRTTHPGGFGLAGSARRHG
jgi:hypothetical protein